MLILCPSLSSPNLVTINLIRNLAEISAVDALQSYDWGNQTSYQYAGLAGVSNFSEVAGCTKIVILGGLVSFSANSQVIPTESVVESIVTTVLSSKSFELSLQSQFPNLTAVTYQRVVHPTAAPSQSPHGVNSVTSPQESQSSQSGASVNLGVIVGAAVGGVVGIIIVALIFLVRRGRTKTWENSKSKVLSTVSNSHQKPCENHSASPQKPADVGSESGVSHSGRLGRMLIAASKPTRASNQNANEVDTSQGSTREESTRDDDDDDNSYSSDFVRIRVIEPPSILPVLSLESFEEEKGRHVLKKDMMISETTFPAWRTSPGSSPDETNVPCALQPTDLSAKALAAEWASTSLLDRVRGKDDRSSATGEASDFALDDLWDPDDCEASVASQKSDPFLPSQATV